MAEPKVVHQYRRARLLADYLTRVCTADAAADLATDLPARSWGHAAEHLGITPPSDDTVALTIELLRERTT